MNKKGISVLVLLCMIGSMDFVYVIMPATATSPRLEVNEVTGGHIFNIISPNEYDVVNALTCDDKTWYNRVISHETMTAGGTTRIATQNTAHHLGWEGSALLGLEPVRISLDNVIWTTPVSPNGHVGVSLLPYDHLKSIDKETLKFYYKVHNEIPDSVNDNVDVVVRMYRDKAGSGFDSWETRKDRVTLLQSDRLDVDTGRTQGYMLTSASDTGGTYIWLAFNIDGLSVSSQRMNISALGSAYPALLPSTNSFQIPYAFSHQKSTADLTQSHYNFEHDAKRGDVLFVKSLLDPGTDGTAGSYINNIDNYSLREQWPRNAYSTDLHHMVEYSSNVDFANSVYNSDTSFPGITASTINFSNAQIDLLVANSDLDNSMLRFSRNQDTNSIPDKWVLGAQLLRPVYPISGFTVPQIHDTEMYIPNYYFSDSEVKCKATVYYFGIGDTAPSLLTNTVTITPEWDCNRDDYTVQESVLTRIGNVDFDSIVPDDYCSVNEFNERIGITEFPVQLEPVVVWRDHLSVVYGTGSRNPDTNLNLIWHARNTDTFRGQYGPTYGCYLYDDVTGQQVGKYGYGSNRGGISSGQRINTEPLNYYHGHSLICKLYSTEGPIDVNIGVPPNRSIFEMILYAMNRDDFGIGINENIFGLSISSVLAIMIGMVGFNRKYIPVSAVLAVTIYGVFGYMGILNITSVILGAWIVVVMLAIFSRGFK